MFQALGFVLLLAKVLWVTPLSAVGPLLKVLLTQYVSGNVWCYLD
jgi:hypothetical protein